MFYELYRFFANSVFNAQSGTTIYNYLTGTHFTIGGTSYDLKGYLCTISSLISLVFILVLCCLFVYKIVRLIGGLIR